MAFIVVMKRGMNIKSGNKSIGFGNFVDQKINASRQIELNDRDLQNHLFGESLKIDSRCTAEMKRIIRNLDNDITTIFTEHIKCEFPAMEIYRIISQELFQRIEDNNLRERFSIHEKNGYIDDIEYKIKIKYDNFLLRLNTVSCGESYPEWQNVQSEIHKMLLTWADDTITVLVARISEKIDIYEKTECRFKTAEYKHSAIIYPIQKNYNYLEALGCRRV
jgi:hypothetical protein